MKINLIAAAIFAVGLSAVPAMAQSVTPAAVVPTEGAQVFDPEGNQVGTVESVQGDVVTVSTGSARAGLPRTAFAVREKGLTIGMTRAQLEAAVSGAAAQNSAARDAAMIVGADVKSSDGVVLGKIVEVAGEDVTVSLAGGARVALKKSNFGLRPDQSLVLGMTAADFAKATEAAGTAQANAEPDGNTASGNTATPPREGQ